MRVLCTTLTSSGHSHPLVPFAEALRAAGLRPLLEPYPPFTPEFVARYPEYAH